MVGSSYVIIRLIVIAAISSYPSLQRVEMSDVETMGRNALMKGADFITAFMGGIPVPSSEKPPWLQDLGEASALEKAHAHALEEKVDQLEALRGAIPE